MRHKQKLRRTSEEAGMRRRSTRTATTAAAVVAALALAACGSGGPAAPTAEAPSTAVNGAGRTLTVWDFETADTDRGIAWAKAREIFEAETGAKVAYEKKAFEQVRTTASQVLNSDAAPDVLEYNKGNATSGLLASQGLLTPLDDAVATFGWDKKIPGTLQTTARYDDKGVMGSGSWYGIPNYGEFTEVYYNKDLFAQHGVAVPKTYAEFTAALQTFAAAGITPIAAAGAEYPYQQLLYQLALSKADRPWVTNYETYSAPANFHDPAWTYAADELKSWIDKGYLDKNSTGLKAEDMGLAFESGKYPMMVSGSWWYARMVKEATGFQWGTFLFPDSPLTMGSAGNQWVVPTRSAEKDLAYAFIDITMRPEVQNLIAQNNGIPIVTDTSAVTDPKSVELLQNWQTVVGRDGLGFYPDWPAPTFYDDLVGATQELANGTLTPTAMLDQLQQRYDSGVAELK
jgi:raffinose/stachyose/melibiose transport system substrate-binding protein